MRRPHTPRPIRPATSGMTLVELLVALAVFAILGALSYRAIAQMSDLERHLESQHTHWRDLEHAAHRIEHDLLRLAMPPPGTTTLSLHGPRDHQVLQLLVDERVHARMRPVQFRNEDRRLLRTRPDARPERREVLADGVDRLAWRFIHRGRWYTSWPPAGTDPSEVPDAIELTIDVTGIGPLMRLMPLR